MPKFREVLEKAGVRFLDRWFLYELLLTKDQQIRGAIVISTREDTYCAILCKAVILAAGSCSLRAAYFGHQFSTGDGYAAAVKAGATLVNMEAVNHNVSLREYDTTGGAFFREHGVKYRNCRGEEFMHKYKGLPTGHAMAVEVKETKGPLFMDLTTVKPGDFSEAGKIMPWLKLILERATIDDPSRVPCVAAFCGSRATSAGIFVSIDGESSVDGLFVTGDAGAMLSNGMGAMGINLMTCSVFGSRCGMNAARFSANREIPREKEIEEIERSITVPAKGDGDLSANTVLIEIQKAVLPQEVVLIKEESRLKKALGRIEEIREEMLPLMEIRDIRSLIRALETENMLLYCEAMFKSSLERRESRRLHYREDYPSPDNENWLKWVKTSGNLGTLTITTEDIPPDAFTYLRPPRG
jgi:succinate dehydrogenase / fumarate reductase flavoprotein subunit